MVSLPGLCWSRGYTQTGRAKAINQVGLCKEEPHPSVPSHWNQCFLSPFRHPLRRSPPHRGDLWPLFKSQASSQRPACLPPGPGIYPLISILKASLVREQICCFERQGSKIQQHPPNPVRTREGGLWGTVGVRWYCTVFSDVENQELTLFLHESSA